MKTYVFRVVVEPDEDGWHVYCPVLLEQGGATWGQTKEEAMKNIQEVLEMVMEDLVECEDPLPEGSEEEMYVCAEPWVAITIPNAD